MLKARPSAPSGSRGSGTVQAAGWAVVIVRTVRTRLWARLAAGSTESLDVSLIAFGHPVKFAGLRIENISLVRARDRFLACLIPTLNPGSAVGGHAVEPLLLMRIITFDAPNERAVGDGAKELHRVRGMPVDDTFLVIVINSLHLTGLKVLSSYQIPALNRMSVHAWHRLGAFLGLFELTRG